MAVSVRRDIAFYAVGDRCGHCPGLLVAMLIQSAMLAAALFGYGEIMCATAFCLAGVAGGFTNVAH